jgi:CBS domain-containing protein
MDEHDDELQSEEAITTARGPGMLARNLMQPNPVTVSAQTPLLEVQHVLVVAHISGVPVVGENGQVTGVVSAADVLSAIEQALDEDHDPGESDDLLGELRAITAGDIASPEVVWVSPDTAVAEVARMMLAAGARRVLVGNGRLEGILTAYDLLRAVDVG